MALATQIREKINQLPFGETFGYGDLRIAKDKYQTAAKALERFQKDGLIKKVSKGVFYKPEITLFGELKPDYEELLRPYLFENGKRVAYITGTTLYNRLGLTMQVANRIKIASRGKRINVDRGALKAGAVKSYTEVSEANYEVLGLLDAFKDIKRIPDCSVAQALRRLSTILREFSKQQIESVIKFALAYPPRVRALVGAILQNNGHTDKGLEKLKNSLNPFTIINLGLKETELTTKIDWHIK